MTTPTLRASDASGQTLDDPTDIQVHDLFACLNARWPFSIVARLDREPLGHFYFQMHLEYVGDQDPDADEEVDVDYEVQFRDGGADRHYRARVLGDYTIAGKDLAYLVYTVYHAWRTEDPGLAELLPWELLEPHS
ncbi:hypothetical protein [Nocardia macrotermitis]|uniref:hypothetical protein n=1 Tax=Nocardia macrotermitis TaxID=2585198 RepID=UPI001297D42A|nr:hypothetical protein [Nocardia macrotermitis]